MKVLNCSSHNLTNEQIVELKDFEIVELPKELKEAWGQLTPKNYIYICKEIIKFCHNNNIDVIHLAGFPLAVVYLCSMEPNIKKISAYSKRVVVEQRLENGEVIKKSIFKHEGFYKFEKIA